MCIQLHTLYIELMVSTYHINCIHVLYPVLPYRQTSSILFLLPAFILFLLPASILFLLPASILTFVFRHLYYPWNCFQLYYYITHVITRSWVGYSFNLCPIMMSLNSMNFAPCRGFVKKSATMYSVGQCTILISFLSIRSFIKKKRVLMCLVLWLLDIRPFFCNNSALWLS